MADDIDAAAIAQDALIARGLARVSTAMAVGAPGECDECGEWMPRLVGGRCGFCRDGRRPPAEAYDRAAQLKQSTMENSEMTSKIATNSRVISMPVTGDVLAAIERRAEERDLPLGQAARSFIEEAITTPSRAADMPIKPAATTDWDGTRASAMIAVGNIPDAWLIEEVSRRLSAGVGSDDYAAAVARAEAAESRLDQARSLLVG